MKLIRTMWLLMSADRQLAVLQGIVNEIRFSSAGKTTLQFQLFDMLESEYYDIVCEGLIALAWKAIRAEETTNA